MPADLTYAVLIDGTTTTLAVARQWAKNGAGETARIGQLLVENLEGKGLEETHYARSRDALAVAEAVKRIDPHEIVSVHVWIEEEGP